MRASVVNSEGNTAQPKLDTGENKKTPAGSENQTSLHLRTSTR